MKKASGCFTISMTMVTLAAVIVIFCTSMTSTKAIVCVTNATDGSAICFDGDQTMAFSAEKFKQINSYDVIENNDDRSTGRRRKCKCNYNWLNFLSMHNCIQVRLRARHSTIILQEANESFKKVFFIIDI